MLSNPSVKETNTAFLKYCMQLALLLIITITIIKFEEGKVQRVTNACFHNYCIFVIVIYIDKTNYFFKRDKNVSQTEYCSIFA